MTSNSTALKNNSIKTPGSRGLWALLFCLHHVMTDASSSVCNAASHLRPYSDLPTPQPSPLQVAGWCVKRELLFDKCGVLHCAQQTRFGTPWETSWLTCLFAAFWSNNIEWGIKFWSLLWDCWSQAHEQFRSSSNHGSFPDNLSSLDYAHIFFHFLPN